MALEHDLGKNASRLRSHNRVFQYGFCQLGGMSCTSPVFEVEFLLFYVRKNKNAYIPHSTTVHLYIYGGWRVYVLAVTSVGSCRILQYNNTAMCVYNILCVQNVLIFVQFVGRIYSR